MGTYNKYSRMMAGPSITKHEIDIVNDALINGWYEEAYKYVELFQNEFAKYHNRKFGIMTPNCTTAIHLLLLGMGIKEGDEIIVPDCTWIASVAPIVWCGAKPIFCDINPITWCMNPLAAKQAITPKTKAILLVNLYGNMCDMNAFKKISLEYNIPIIEDAAESLGSVYHGTKSGGFGIGSTFSFHRTKTLCTGEGGMLLIDDDKLYERCMFLRDHGRSKIKMYYNDEVAYKYMPTNILAALGYAQFLRLSELIKKKQDQLHFYKEQFKDFGGVTLNYESENIINGAWITAIVYDNEWYRVDKETLIQKSQSQFDMPLRPFFYPLSSMPAFKEFNTYKIKNAVAYNISDRGFNLPGAFNLTEDQMKETCDVIKNLLNESK